MRKIISVLVIVLALVGCQNSNNNEDSTESFKRHINIDTASSVPHLDIENYCDAAQNIYTGKVLDIYFGIWEYDSNVVTKYPSLYMIYKVQVDEVYKGAPDSIVYVSVFGTKKGYKEKEQLTIMKKHGYEEDVLPEYNNTPRPVDIGDECLFITGTRDKYERLVCNHCCMINKNNEYDYNKVMAYIEAPEFDKNVLDEDRYKEVLVGAVEAVTFKTYEKDGEYKPYTVYSVYNGEEMKQIIYPGGYRYNHSDEQVELMKEVGVTLDFDNDKNDWPTVAIGNQCKFYMSDEMIGEYPLCSWLSDYWLGEQDGKMIEYK